MPESEIPVERTPGFVLDCDAASITFDEPVFAVFLDADGVYKPIEQGNA